jgi:hypothetical protein
MGKMRKMGKKWLGWGGLDQRIFIWRKFKLIPWDLPIKAR